MPFHTNTTTVPVDSREHRILERVQSGGVVDIGELARQFGVTPQTVRRAVNRLSERGLLRRVHGGVTLPPGSINLPYETRQIHCLHGKQRIAQAVALHIADGASVSIGLGTTPQQVALALRARRGLRVVTNSLRVVMALAHCDGVELVVAGGHLRPADLDVVGEAAARCFAGFKTDHAIFGVGGIDEDGTLLDFDPAEVVAREAMRQNCRQSILVADSSKFGRAAMARGGRLEAVDHLFIDHRPPEPYGALLAQVRPRVHVAADAGSGP